MPQITTSTRTEKPLIPIRMISHGTLNSIDMQASRRFYEEVLGFEVIQVSPVSMLLRQVSEPPPVAAEVNPEVPPELSDWIAKLLLKEMRARPATATGQVSSAWTSFSAPRPTQGWAATATTR